MTLIDVLNFRRSVRVFDKNKPLDAEKVMHCIEMATLAPNSSNMQLWEFYHVINPALKTKITHACLGQSATATADQIIVIVTRQDQYRQHAKSVLNFERKNILQYSPKERQERRIKNRELYYGKIMPLLYTRFLGILGFLRVVITKTIGVFRTIIREVSENDMRVVVHKSAALAAQTFMIAMANEGYDTCPIEGFDSHVLKKTLNLPYGSEINMVIACGIRDGNKGIWGDRFRLPFDEVYRRI